MRFIPVMMLFATVSLMSFAACAAEDAPLEISADKALEWNQGKKLYIARGNAVAVQGTTSVSSDILTASYDGANGSTSDISLLTAEGHVVLKSGNDVAKGDKAIYNVKTGEATLSGQRPTIIQDGKNTLEADEIVVWTDTTSGTSLQKAEATGHVVITSGTQTATSNKATYNAATKLVTLTGNVNVKQGENWLQGDKADINLQTHVSTMTNQGGNGRVKGIFHSKKAD